MVEPNCQRAHYLIALHQDNIRSPKVWAEYRCLEFDRDGFKIWVPQIAFRAFWGHIFKKSFNGEACNKLHALLLAWQNYWMLIGWEEYNYFINCTAVQLMIFPKQTKWRKGILNTNVKWNCSGVTRWKYEQKHLILVECLAGLGFGERIWCWHWEVLIQFCHANNKQVIMRCCSYN